MQNGLFGASIEDLEQEINESEASTPAPISAARIAQRPKSNPFVYIADRDGPISGPRRNQPQRPTPPKQGINLDVLRPKREAPRQSSEPKIERPASKGFSVARTASSDVAKIQIEKVAAPSSIVVAKKSPGDSENAELCPFCGLISFPYNELLQHILQSHRFVEALFASVKVRGNGKCAKCGGSYGSDNQLVLHCCADHDKEVLRVLRDSRSDKWEAKRKEIDEFIEKHAPELNPRYKRRCNVSESESGSDDDDAHVDDDYTTFIASSINAGGLTSTGQAGVKPVIAAAKVEFHSSKAGVEVSSIHEFLGKLHHCEKFMRQHGLVYTSDRVFECLICRKSFDSSVRLFDHCLTAHRLKITDDVRQVLWIFNRDVEGDEDEEQLMRHPELRLDLLLRPVMKTPELTRQVSLLNVPSILVDFVLDLLADQPRDVPLRGHTPKEFGEPMLIMIKLPAPLPVVFQKSEKPRNTKLGFIDTPYVRAADIEKQIGAVLSSLSKEQYFEIEFTGMAMTGFTEPELERVGKDCDMTILKTPDVYDEQTGTRSFFLIALAKDPSDKNLAKLQQHIAEMFEPAQLYLCRKCKLAVRPNCTEKCSGPRAQGLTIQIKEGSHELDMEGSFSTCSCNAKTASELF